LGKVKGKVFRIGHLGDFNDLSLAGTLSGVEMGLALAGVPHQAGGVAAALAYLTESQPRPLEAAEADKLYSAVCFWLLMSAKSGSRNLRR
jgi:alanine-glyoxylate transaminase/serine-glyoxylate transaminase/serine-pyruvate transaminase